MQVVATVEWPFFRTVRHTAILKLYLERTCYAGDDLLWEKDVAMISVCDVEEICKNEWWVFDLPVFIWLFLQLETVPYYVALCDQVLCVAM